MASRPVRSLTRWRRATPMPLGMPPPGPPPARGVSPHTPIPAYPAYPSRRTALGPFMPHPSGGAHEALQRALRPDPATFAARPLAAELVACVEARARFRRDPGASARDCCGITLVTIRSSAMGRFGTRVSSPPGAPQPKPSASTLPLPRTPSAALSTGPGSGMQRERRTLAHGAGRRTQAMTENQGTRPGSPEGPAVCTTSTRQPHTRP